MNQVIDALAVAATGPMVGAEFAVAAFANPLFARLPDDAFRAARGDAARVLGKVMPFWYFGTLLALVAATIVSWGEARGWLCAVAAGLMAAVLVLTVTMLVPVNNRIAARPATVELARELAGRWDRLHWLRVAVLVVVLSALTIVVT